MQSDKLIPQLELYSNAIVGFMVAQSVAFSFTMGTNPTFSCHIISEGVLAAMLAAHFVLSTALAGFALRYLSRSMRSLSSENEQLIRYLFRAKVVVVVLFALIPVGLLLGYGTSLFGEHVCGAQAHKAGGA